MSLSSLIVQREVASIRQVEEALARQVIYGGDLVTNLLEVTPVDEQVVAALLAESAGIPAMEPGALPTPSEQARSLVPAELAAHRSMVPLGIEGGKLLVAVAEPLPREVAEELEFTLGLPVEQLIASTIRVREALSRIYGLPFEHRLRRLAANLGDRVATLPIRASIQSPPAADPPSPPPASTPPSSAIAAPPAPASEPPSAAPSTAPEPSEKVPSAPPVHAELPPAVEPAPESAPSSGKGDAPVSTRPSLFTRDVAAPAPRPRRRRGPLTLDMAKKELQAASDRDALLDLFFDFARQFFEYSALFVVHADIAEGRDAWGAGASRERVLGIGVPLDMASVLSTARELRRTVTTRPLPDGLDAVLLEDLQRPIQTTVSAVPIVVRTRVVALLLGDCGDVAPDAGAPEVSLFAAAVGSAFERLIMRRKLAGFSAGTPANHAGRVSERAAASVPSKRVNGVHEEAHAEAHARPSLPAPPRVHDPDAPTPLAPPVRAPSPSTPELDVAVLDPAASRALLEELGREIEEVDASPSVEGTQAVAVPPHSPPSSRTFESEKELPTVIVDIARELGALVERVIERGTDDAAEAELLRQGTAALNVLMQRFPGPIVADPASASGDQAPVRRASEGGPVLRLVAAQRRTALPFVLARTDSPDPEVRYWATFLISELAYPEALPSLVPRLCDSEPRIRRAARAALGAVLRSAPRDVVFDVLSQSLMLEEKGRAMLVLDALVELREPATVPVLVHLLSSGDAELAAAARKALVVITCQDFGQDARPWATWWSHHGARHRVEWLIDALLHDMSEIRRAAAEELQALTRESFGYGDELGPRDRERVHQRYRDWWSAEGRARFVSH